MALSQRHAVVPLLAALLLAPDTNMAQESDEWWEGEWDVELMQEELEYVSDAAGLFERDAASCTSDGNIVYTYGTNGVTLVSRYYKQSGVCGSDSDYVFEFYPTWGGDNSFDIRWYDMSSYVRYVLQLAYPNGLTHIGSTCSSPIKICIGQKTLTAIGGWPSSGAYIVATTMYIWHY